MNGLFQRLQIGDMVQAQAVLVPGGLAAERGARCEAGIVLQQASALPQQAQALLAAFAAASAAPVIRGKGMEPTH